MPASMRLWNFVITICRLVREARVTGRPSWSERIYDHNRQYLRWLIPMVAVLGAWDLWILYRAAARHVIYGRIEEGGRGYIWLAEDPTRFWITFGIHTVALVPLVVLPIWLVLGWRAAKARAISTSKSDDS
jgi:hypothetical protein